uniref:Uncharacterized protein n=1 Tax=Melopsittacus undulatus TaxID=13146 RepID=A0A8V5GCG7_MELUD
AELPDRALSGLVPPLLGPSPVSPCSRQLELTAPGQVQLRTWGSLGGSRCSELRLLDAELPPAQVLKASSLELLTQCLSLSLCGQNLEIFTFLINFSRRILFICLLIRKSTGLAPYLLPPTFRK